MPDQPTNWGHPYASPPPGPPQAGPAPVTVVPVPASQPAAPRKSTAWSVIKVLFVIGLGVALLVSVVLNLLLLAAVGSDSTSARITEQTMPDLGVAGAREKIAVIPIDGVIEPGSVERWGQMVDRARRETRVKAVVLAVNSPGGGMTAADDLHRRVLKLQGEGKPIVVSMGGIATSGAYYISMPAAEILAQPTTITGSIGVMMPHINIAELMKKHGVKDETFVAQGSHKKYSISWTKETTPEGRQMIQAILDDAYERFIEVVTTGRSNLSEVRVRALADGSVYTASQAKQSGLIDRIGYLEDAVARAKTLAGLTRVKVVRYRYIEPFSLRSLLGIESRPTTVTIDPGRLLAPKGPQVLYLWPGWSETVSRGTPRLR